MTSLAGRGPSSVLFQGCAKKKGAGAPRYCVKQTWFFPAALAR